MKKRDKTNDIIKFYKPETGPDMWIPLHISSIHAGFPSPAEPYIEDSIDLNKTLIRDAACTFFARVEGDCMEEKGSPIMDKSMLIVDKSVIPQDNQVALCYLDGEFVVRRLRFIGGRIELHAENKQYQTIHITPEMDFRVWGKVEYAVNKVA